MKLTAAEKKWIEDLQAHLNACPSERIGFYTIGDRDVELYDRTKEAKINGLVDSGKASDFPVAVDDLDASIGRVVFPALVHSVSG